MHINIRTESRNRRPFNTNTYARTTVHSHVHLDKISYDIIVRYVYGRNQHWHDVTCN